MRYLNILKYIDDPDAVAAVRSVHRAYLAELLHRGHLAAGGPFEDLTGALFIYEAESAMEAERLAADDPCTKKGLIREHSIQPWLVMYSDPELLRLPAS